jgi:hypothetical protein
MRAVLGRRRCARYAAEPAHGLATAGRDQRAGDKTLRDANSRDEGVLSVAVDFDLIFSGLFERHPRLTLATVEFELA